MEYTFLELCDFKFFISNEVYENYNNYLNSLEKYQLIYKN